jgi:hypothetical protein
VDIGLANILDLGPEDQVLTKDQFVAAITRCAKNSDIFDYRTRAIKLDNESPFANYVKMKLQPDTHFINLEDAFEVLQHHFLEP